MEKKFLLIHDNSIMAADDELEGEILQTLCDEVATLICLHPGATFGDSPEPASVEAVAEAVNSGASWFTLAWDEDGRAETDVFHIETLVLDS